MTFSCRSALTHIAIVALVVAAFAPARANPTGGTVVAGSATISTAPHAVNVTQNTNIAIVNWQGFSIGSGEVTQFTQPSSSSAILNRVTSSNPSQIYGQLKGNGQVFLINPNGILIGPSGQIETGSFIGSTLDVANAAFMAGGALNFSGQSSAGIVNLGTIRADSGDVGLFATQVQNGGTIAAPNGTAALGSGSQILYAPGGGDNTILIQAPPLTTPNGAAVDNSGVITAAAAQLKAAGSPYALAVNSSGLISATTVHEDGGRVLLDGGAGSTVMSGTINADATGSGDGGSIVIKGGDTTFTGTITARGGPQGGNGGTGEVSGQTANFLGAVDMTAPHGNMGTVLIDPVNEVISGMVATNISNALSDTGIIEQATQSITVLDPVSSTTGTGNFTMDAPTITVNAPITYTHGTVQFQNSSGTTTGTSLTVTAPLLANFINLGGPFATANFSAPVIGILNVNQAGAGVASLTATDPGNAISALNLYSGDTFTGALTVSSTTPLAVSGSVTAGSFGLTSSDNLTLTPGTQLTSSGGDTTLASTGGVFINGAGSGALPGPGRKIIYTTTDANGFSDGDLGYTEFNGVTFSNDPLGTGNVTYVVNASNLPFMTITANDLTSIYGAADNFTAFYTNGAGSDLSTLPLFGIQQGSDANVGTYTIVPFGAASSTHRLNYVDGTLTVNPAPLVITANNISMPYGTLPVPGDDSFQFTGLVNGDTSSVIQGLSATLPIQATSNVGNYAIVPNAAAAANYAISYVNGTWTVTPAPLVITGPSQSITYGNVPLLGPFLVTFSGLVNGDRSIPGVEVSVPVGSLSDVGTYFTLPFGGVAPNYAITYRSGTITVTPAPLYYTVNSAAIQQGQPLPPLSVSISGFVNNDTPKTSACCFSPSTDATSSSGPGEYPILAGFTPINVSENYTLRPNPATGATGTLTITPPPFTLPRVPVAPASPQTQTVSYSAALDPLGFGADSPALLIETDIITAYARANGYSVSYLNNVLQNPSLNQDLDTSLLGNIQNIAYKELQDALNSAPSSWNPVQNAFVLAVTNEIQNQREAAAQQAESAFLAYQVPNSSTDVVSATNDVPLSFVYQATVGMTSTQIATLYEDGIQVLPPAYNGPTGPAGAATFAGFSAVLKSAYEPVTVQDLKTLLASSPSLSNYLTAMMSNNP